MKKSWLVNKHTRNTWGSQTTRTKPLGVMTKHMIRTLSEQTARLARKKITGLSVSIASGISNKPNSSPMMELIPISGKLREVNFKRKRVNVLPQSILPVYVHVSLNYLNVILNNA